MHGVFQTTLEIKKHPVIAQSAARGRLSGDAGIQATGAMTLVKRALINRSPVEERVEITLRTEVVWIAQYMLRGAGSPASAGMMGSRDQA